ncbi:hypothetical protein GCM10011533_16670 [Streptosporangium jomthongense]|nr:hypothetical protein GCM10011533_16670 [Streptosporangium jomthongense]
MLGKIFRLAFVKLQDCGADKDDIHTRKPNREGACGLAKDARKSPAALMIYLPVEFTNFYKVRIVNSR